MNCPRWTCHIAFVEAMLVGCGAPQPATTVLPPLPVQNEWVQGIDATHDGLNSETVYLPVNLDPLPREGIQPGGAVRIRAGGARLLRLPNGSVRVAADRLPTTPDHVQALPERLGGGFLFSLGTTVARASEWLSSPEPIFEATSTITALVVGMDRVHVRHAYTMGESFDPVTGARRDRGPWPDSPWIGSYVALDGWRAVAIADLRGVVATWDAGSTWKSIPLPLDARSLSVEGDVVVASGLDGHRNPVAYEVTDRNEVRVHEAPKETATERVRDLPPARDSRGAMFGPNHLRAAVEDGWLIESNVVLAAREGKLARIRVPDGELLTVTSNAFSLLGGRCMPVSLARDDDPARFGFVCRESQGPTVVYRYDAASDRLDELRRFAQSRRVESSGNGALVVHGPCAEEAKEEEGKGTYCALPRKGSWSEIQLKDASVRERVVVLSDGRLAVVSPPKEGDTTAAHVTIVSSGETHEAALTFPSMSPDQERVVREGIWLLGFQERKPGVLGGWVESAGSVLGIEVMLEGGVTVGTYIRDAGYPVVCGRFGMGWSASRRGFETTDGGMTWRSLEVPEPLEPMRVAPRACGVVGCTLAGWFRIGWGRSASRRLPPFDTYLRPPRAARPAVSQDWLCDVVKSTPIVERFPAGKDNVTVSTHDVIDRTSRINSFAQLTVDRAQRNEAGLLAWSVRWTTPWGLLPSAGTSRSSAPFSSLDDASLALGAGAGRSVAWMLGAGDDDNRVLLVRRHGNPHESTVFALEANRPIEPIVRADGLPFGTVEAMVRSGNRWFVSTANGAGELSASVLWQADDSHTAHEVARLPRAGSEGRMRTARLAHRSDGRSIGWVVESLFNSDNSTLERWVVAVDPVTGTVATPLPLGASELTDRPAPRVCTDADRGWIVNGSWNAIIRMRGTVGPMGVLHNIVARTRVWPGGACIERLAGRVDSVDDKVNSLRPVATPVRSTDPSIPILVTTTGRLITLRCTLDTAP